MICNLCEREFTEQQGRSDCSACGFGKRCKGVRCPYCYYEMVPQLAWVQKLRSALTFGRDRANASDSDKNPGWISPLTLLPVNQEALIDHLDMESHRKLEELIAMGVLPGKEVKMIQKFPSFVFQVGFSQFSIDRDLASCIYVKPTLR